MRIILRVIYQDINMNENIYDKLSKLGAQIVKEMGDIIKAKGAVASGNLLRSLDYEVKFEGGVWQLLIEYEDYGYFVDKGRNPGRFPPMQNIKRWMSLKGIPQEALWPIMIKIKKAGFYSKMVGGVALSRPRGIHFTDPFTQNLDLRKVIKDFEGMIVADIENEIVKDIVSSTGKDIITVLKR